MPSPTPARTPAPKAPKPPSPRTGLLLTGGGARAAYQMGVLEAIADLRQACGAGREPNPFPIITGTSAGAINAAALACGADDFDRTVRRIARVWRQFHAHQVYGADSLSVMRSGARWLTLVSLGWAGLWRAGAACARARCWTTRRSKNCWPRWCRSCACPG